MVRGWSIVLGIGLVILGLAGLSGTAGGSWMSWLDFVAALGSFIVAGSVRPATHLGINFTSRFNVTNSTTGSGPMAIAVGLFVMWIIGLSSGTVGRGIVWWNFAFACAFALVGIASGGTRMRMGPPSTGVGEERPRRVA